MKKMFVLSGVVPFFVSFVFFMGIAWSHSVDRFDMYVYATAFTYGILAAVIASGHVTDRFRFCSVFTDVACGTGYAGVVVLQNAHEGFNYALWEGIKELFFTCACLWLGMVVAAALLRIGYSLSKKHDRL